MRRLTLTEQFIEHRGITLDEGIADWWGDLASWKKAALILAGLVTVLAAMYLIVRKIQAARQLSETKALIAQLEDLGGKAMGKYDELAEFLAGRNAPPDLVAHYDRQRGAFSHDYESLIADLNKQAAAGVKPSRDLMSSFQNFLDRSRTEASESSMLLQQAKRVAPFTQYRGDYRMTRSRNVDYSWVKLTGDPPPEVLGARGMAIIRGVDDIDWKEVGKIYLPTGYTISHYPTKRKDRVGTIIYNKDVKKSSAPPPADAIEVSPGFKVVPRPGKTLSRETIGALQDILAGKRDSGYWFNK